MATSTTARLEARISPELHALVKRVSAIQGRSVTDFVVKAVQDAAEQAIERAEVMRLSLQDQQRFAEALFSTPAPAPALERAFARRARLLHPE